MTNKNKLIELLKTNSQIKEQLEELKFGCKYTYYWNSLLMDMKDLISEKSSFEQELKSWAIKIIWNPLSEHHLRMYYHTINKKNFNYRKLTINDYWLLRMRYKTDDNSTEIYLDNTKDFNSQSEECYGKIFNFLNDIKND